MKMGGFVGKVEYQGQVSEFIPLFKLGEKVHVGKATGFGLGKYDVQSSRS
jgi:CRISPR/Cas system endoribonuclease Cas6 (RAMP superfamily)